MKLLIAKAGMISVLLLAGAISARAADSGTPAAANSAQKSADPPKQRTRTPRPNSKNSILSYFARGRRCGRFIVITVTTLRNPAEFAPYQWDQIMMHMRTLENLPPR